MRFVSILAVFALLGPLVGGAFYVVLMFALYALNKAQLLGGLDPFLLDIFYMMGLPPALTTGFAVALRRRFRPLVRLRFAVLVALWVPAGLMSTAAIVAVAMGYSIIDHDPLWRRRDFDDAMTLLTGLTLPSLVATVVCWWIARRRQLV